MRKPETIKQTTDEELAIKAGAGSRACFEELVRRYSGRLFHFFRNKISSNEETEDLIQEAFLKAYRNIDRYNSQWKFSTWLYTLASRLAISYFRSTRKKTTEILPKSPALDPEDALIRKEDSQNLWALAKKQNPSQYEVLWLFYGEDMSVKDVAKVLKKGQINVRVLLHRARLELAGQINRPGQSRELAQAASSGQKLPLL